MNASGSCNRYSATTGIKDLLLFILTCNKQLLSGNDVYQKMPNNFKKLRTAI